MRIKLGALLVAALLSAGPLQQCIDSMSRFYFAGDRAGFELMKGHLERLMEAEGRSSARGLTDRILAEAVQRGDLETVEYLRKIDSQNYRVYLALALLSFNEKKFSRTYAYLKKSLRYLLFDLNGVSELAPLVRKALLYSLWAYFVLLSLVLLSRNLPLLHHDLKELSRGEKNIFVILLTLAVIGLPLVLQIGYAFLPFYIIALLSPYMSSGGGKKLLLLLFISWLVVTFLNFQMPRRDEPAVKLMVDLYYYSFDPETLERGEKLLAERWDQDAAFYLARSFEKVDNFAKAIEYYSKVLEKEPTHFRALNNLAILRLKAREYNLALQFFEKLFSHHRHDIIAFHNYRIILARVGRIDEAGNIAKIGWKLFGKKWEEYVNSDKLISADFYPQDIVAKAAGEKDVTARAHPPGFSLLFLFRKPRPLNPFLFALVLFFLTLVAVSSLELRIGEALYCAGCGKPICYRCSNYSFKGYCNDCMVGFQLNVDSSSYIRLDKIKKKKRRERVRGLLMALWDGVIPGLSRASRGKLTLSLLSFLSLPLLVAGVLSYIKHLPLFMPGFALGALFYLVGLGLNLLLPEEDGA